MSEDSDQAYFGLAEVQRAFQSSTDVDACAVLAGRVAGLIGDALQYFQKAHGDIACQAGCNVCCHLRVMVHPHEAIALHRHLSRLPQEQAQRIRERLTYNAARLLQAAGQAVAPRIPCAFLEDGQCAAYEVRPSACAGYHSLSREACEQDHQAAGAASTPGTPAGIPMSQALRHVAGSLDRGVEAGLKSKGLAGGRVELQTAVAALAAEPALIARWREGRQWRRDAAGLVRRK